MLLAGPANQQIRANDHVTAALVALRGLSSPSFNEHDPLFAPARAALYRALHLRREQSVLSGHERTVIHAAFSPDGTRVVTAHNDGTARL